MGSPLADTGKILLCPTCGKAFKAPAGAEPGGDLPACPKCKSVLVLTDAATSVGSLKPGARLGPYVVLSEIARGGMGAILRAKDGRLGRIVALKVLMAGEGATPEMVARLHREAQSASRLRHPGIVQVHDVGVEGGHHYIAMDFIEGQTLEGLMAKGKVAPEKAAEILAAVAEAVHHAHEEGVIHRDLKPGNVLLDEEGRPHVTDFGIARDTTAGKGLTAAGSVLGTPEYMSPEQAQGARALDARSDVFSLGVILYHLVTGKSPFKAASMMQTMQRVVSLEPPMPSTIARNLPGDLEAIVLKAVEKAPASRYSSAEGLAKDLRRFLAGEPVSVSRPTVFVRAVRVARRRWPLVAGGAAVLVVGVSVWALTARSASIEAEESQRRTRRLEREKKEAEAKADVERKKAEEGRVREAEALQRREAEAYQTARAETLAQIQKQRSFAREKNLAAKGLLGSGKHDDAWKVLSEARRAVGGLLDACDLAAEPFPARLREDPEIRRAAEAGDLLREIEADLAWAHALRGRNVKWFEKWDYPGAIADLDEAVRLDPKNPGHRKSRGLVHLEGRRFPAAADDLGATVGAGDAPPDRIALLRARLHAGRPDEALPLLETLDENDRDYYAAELALADGKFAEAEAAFAEFLDMRGGRGWSRLGYYLPAAAGRVRALVLTGKAGDAVALADQTEKSAEDWRKRFGGGQGRGGGRGNPMDTPEAKRNGEMQMIELRLARAVALLALAKERPAEAAALRGRAKADLDAVRQRFPAEPESERLTRELP